MPTPNGAARPFSIVLPDGKHVTAHRTLFGALHDARKCNASRESRGLPPVRVLNRDTREFYDIRGDENALDVEARVLAEGTA